MTGRPRVPEGGIPIPVPSLHPSTLWLRRFPPDTGAKGARAGKGALLLLHGGNSSGDVLLTPDGGVVDTLRDAGWDVWVLEWRASPYVVDEVLRHPPIGGSVIKECRSYTFDQVASEDIPEALRYVRSHTPPGTRLSIVGHCLGAGMTALACARGFLEPFKIHTLVLCELGLFVEVPWNGWLKPEDFILERVLHGSPECRAVDPRHPESWPAAFQTAYQAWPKAWVPDRGSSVGERLLHYLAFMVGQPYSINRLNSRFRNDGIVDFFGPMHLGLYLHAAQSVRRGYMAPFDSPDIIDRARIAPAHGRAPVAAAPSVTDLNPTYFRDKHVALIGAGQSRLWHRDAVDLMYDWLRNIQGGQPGVTYTKQIFGDYGLQELFWGEKAREVYQAILNALPAGAH